MDLLLKRDCAPYVDFEVWVPNHHWLLKKAVRTTGLQLHAGGVRGSQHWTVDGLLATHHGSRRKVRCSKLAPAVSDGSQVCRLETHGKIAACPRTRMRSGNRTRPGTSDPVGPESAMASLYEVAAVDDVRFWHHQFEEPAPPDSHSLPTPRRRGHRRSADRTHTSCAVCFGSRGQRQREKKQGREAQDGTDIKSSS